MLNPIKVPEIQKTALDYITVQSIVDAIDNDEDMYGIDEVHDEEHAGVVINIHAARTLAQYLLEIHVPENETDRIVDWTDEQVDTLAQLIEFQAEIQKPTYAEFLFNQADEAARDYERSNPGSPMTL